nr:rhamnogalacturonan lyase [Paenalkalicoccus suaedae]
MINLVEKDVSPDRIAIKWERVADAEYYRLAWSDKMTGQMKLKTVQEVTEPHTVLHLSTHSKQYLQIVALKDGEEYDHSEILTVEAVNPKTIQLEYLDRGLLAVPTNEGIFLSWRLLVSEVQKALPEGLQAGDFVVYRNGERLVEVTDSTNYLDKHGTRKDSYQVSLIMNEKEHEPCTAVTPWENAYVDVPLQKPKDGVTPVGEAFTYHANDLSVGDVDGDGEYELIVKWDPSNSKDVSHTGYTGPTLIDAYKLDGTQLYRIDIGKNIRSGAHYTQFLVADFDGDGKAELMFKTAPGTHTIRNGETVFITMPDEDIKAGYAHQDDYRMSTDDYRHYLKNRFMNWHRHPEVTGGRWPSTLEECFGIDKKYDYPLSEENALEMVTYFMEDYAKSRSERNNLSAFEGFIVEGPEYLTVFEGETGRELQTIRYKPGRFDDGLMWGDYAMSHIEPGNRVDRFLGGVVYLDGERPSAVFARGYYTRACVVAYDWDGTSLKERFVTDSGWTPMTNPFNDNPHLVEGEDAHHGALSTQGAHFLTIADVDFDGKQEIIYGGATIDHDGSLLYSSSDTLPEQSAKPGAVAKLGHGDAIHVATIIPDRPGQEIFMVHEGGTWAPYGYALRQAEDGRVLYGEYSGYDTGRGMIGDVIPGQRGLETWAEGLFTAEGTKMSKEMPGTNMSIRWKGDMSTQIIEGAQGDAPVIMDWLRGEQLKAEGTVTNNGTKGNPGLVADLFGDWREELLVPLKDSSAIRIFTNTEITDRKMYTLMHDSQYRAGTANQNICYNQPAYPSFYFASDIDWGNVPIPRVTLPRSKEKE